jgi:hypothetical protein
MIYRKIKSLILLFGVALSISAYAHTSKSITCKDFQGLQDLKQKIISLDEKFDWNSSDCKIVGTRSTFPKKDNHGKFKFENGLQVFVYQDYQLKFICLPGWLCKTW